MAFKPENGRARLGALASLLLAVSCGATTLEVGKNNPGDPRQPTAAPPRSRVLQPDFDPASLAPGAAETAAPADTAPSSAVVYVCPMHPEAKRDAPGRCPICGMKLESYSPVHEAEHSSS